MHIKKFAFSLMEIMVVLAVLGIISVILLPVNTSSRPNKDLLMVKKAFYTSNQVVHEMLNGDNDYYDTKLSEGYDVVLPDGTTTIANEKFCLIFESLVSTIGHTNNCSNTTADWNNPSFITTDGLYWVILAHDPTTLTFDVMIKLDPDSARTYTFKFFENGEGSFVKGGGVGDLDKSILDD